MTVLEGEPSWHLLLEISIVVYVYYFGVVGTFLFTCLQYLVFVGAFLFTNLPFFVVLNSTLMYKQVCLLHCISFVAFVYNSNVKRCKSETPVFIRFLKNLHFICYINRKLLYSKNCMWSGFCKYLENVYSLTAPAAAIMLRNDTKGKDFCYKCFYFSFVFLFLCL